MGIWSRIWFKGSSFRPHYSLPTELGHNSGLFGLVVSIGNKMGLILRGFRGCIELVPKQA